MLYIEDRPYQEYVLSHHPKNVKKQVFPSLKAWEMPAALAQMHDEYSTSISPGTLAMDRFWEVFVENVLPKVGYLGGPYRRLRGTAGANVGMVWTGMDSGHHAVPAFGRSMLGGMRDKEASERHHSSEGSSGAADGEWGRSTSEHRKSERSSISGASSYGAAGAGEDDSGFSKITKIVKNASFKRNRDEWSREAATHPNSKYYLPETDRALIRTRPYDTLSIFEFMKGFLDEIMNDHASLLAEEAAEAKERKKAIENGEFAKYDKDKKEKDAKKRKEQQEPLATMREARKSDDPFDNEVMESVAEQVRTPDVLKKLLRILGGKDNESNAREDLNKLRRFVTVKESVFQLVPGISSSASTGVREAVWRRGYWHIARSQVPKLFLHSLFCCSHICFALLCDPSSCCD